MAKKSNSKRKRARPNTSLAQHQRKGKVLNSPFGGLPNLRTVTWLRDSFPDYLWACWHLAEDLEKGRKVIVATLDAVNRVLDATTASTPAERPAFDGSLTSWEGIPADARGAILDDFASRRVYDLVVPETFAHILGMYPTAPGSWILGLWRAEDSFRVEPDRAEAGLATVIAAAHHGRDPVATHAKAFCLRGLTTAQRIHFGPDVTTIELLSRWPEGLSEDERARADSFIRATFMGAGNQLLEADGSVRLDWSTQFWRANWSLFPCRVADDGNVRVDAPAVFAAAEDLRRRLAALWQGFEKAAISSDPDLFDPDRNEVLTGLTARSLRIVSSAIDSPADWTAEHAPARLRALIETLITITWLTDRDDPQLYARFKAFGQGRLKLLKLHLEEFADSLDSVPASVQAQIDELDALVNQDLSEEFQNIDLGGSFAGMDTRRMADAVDLGQEYRLGFAPSSSDAHGEWAHLDRYALTRCLNPAHRWHRVTRQDLLPTISPGIIDSMLDLADRIVSRYLDHIDGDSTAQTAPDVQHAPREPAASVDELDHPVGPD